MVADEPQEAENSDGAALAERIDAAVAEMSELGKRLSLIGLAEHVREELPDSDALWSLVVALQYVYIVDAESERRQHFGPYGPLVEGTLESGELFRLPPTLEDLPTQDVAIWRSCANKKMHPIVRARLADLLWVLRDGEAPHRWFPLAIDSYVEAAELAWDDILEVREGLFRALELCRSLNQREREGPVVEALTGMARRSLDGRAHQPGLIVPILEELTASHEVLAATMVDEALGIYADDPWTMESLLELAAQIRGADERDALAEQEVAGFVKLAEAAEGMQRYAFLQKAAELAATKGLADTHHEIATRIEAISWDEMGYGRVRAEMDIPVDAVEDWVASIVGDDDLVSALTRFGSTIPTGDVAENRTFVEELAEAHPLQRLISRRITGEHNSVLWEATDADAHRELDLSQHEQQRIRFFAQFVGLRAMRGMLAQYAPSADDVAGHFCTPFIEPEVAERIARALALWEQGDADSAASVLAPRLERIVRRACHGIGIRVTKNADMTRGLPGGVLGLGALLSSLDGKLGESERRYLRGALVDVASLNLRNRVGHGLIDLATEADFAVLFHVACFLRLLNPSTGDG